MKGHLRHYRLLALILYSPAQWIAHSEGGVVTLATGPASRHLKLKPAGLRSELRRLHREGIVVALDFEYGVAHLQLRPPLLR